MQENEKLGWLIRDNRNVILGPFSHQEVLQLLKKGQLKNKTEISRANAYWFQVDEKKEIQRFFPELGGEPSPEETQMTATLTQAENSNQGVELTQFVVMPTRKEVVDETKSAEENKVTTSNSSQIQWLNSEMAEEFGDEMEALSLQTGTQIPSPTSGEKTNEPISDSKLDTLPSEEKHSQTERPRPIGNLIKAPEKTGASVYTQLSSNVVSVPVEASAAGRILTEDHDSGPGKRLLAFAVILVVFAGGTWVLTKKKTVKNPQPAAQRPLLSYEALSNTVKKSLVLFDLETAKTSLGDLELLPESTGRAFPALAQALLKKEFLYDGDSAINSLQMAKSLAQDAREIREIDNLLAAYDSDRDAPGAVAQLQRILKSNPDLPVFRYNLALVYLKMGRNADAVETAQALASSLPARDRMVESANVLVGWAKSEHSKGADRGAETAFGQALASNPYSDKAILGLALQRLRHGGLRAAEGDFRAFVDLLPQLETPSQVVNFRKMHDFAFYHFARAQIRELNIPGGVVGSKPSSLVMAVDAVLSCLQSRTGEARKILEGALSNSPGDPHLLKALAYLRWKEGRFVDVAEVLKDLKQEKSNFATNLLLGKAYLKMGKPDQAKDHFELLTEQYSQRSEGWSYLGEVLFQKKRRPEAEKAWKTALARDNYDLLALRGLDRLGKGEVVSEAIRQNLPF